ncbi:glycosyltransferase [Vibrio breoganii]|uniref:glycosyltransferase n=1 Tax=Vibrio breoganii TaxID=553239 RepID=UPI000C84F0B4|nr:glycosyltransferase [Vibrio breoganii]PMO31953.1 hypothetical protein BCT12_17140 [Vibrio breoganii]
MKNFIIVQNSLRTVWIFRADYIKKLVNLGRVVIIAPCDDDLAYAELLKLGVDIVDTPTPSGLIGRFYLAFHMNLSVLKYRFSSNGNTVFIVFFVSTFLLTYFSVVPFNKMHVVSVEGLGSFFSKNNFNKCLLRLLLSWSSGIKMYSNSDELNSVGGKGGILTNGIGVNLSDFLPLNKGKVIRKKEVNIMYVGRLIEDKGVLDVVKVFRLLFKKHSNVNCIMVGDIYPSNPTSITGEDIEKLKAEFGSRIDFPGFSSDIKSWYKIADILILPSVREGFPVCVMEANAMGLPCVGYDVPGLSDAIQNGINGHLCDFKDLNQLTLNLEFLIDQYKNGFDSDTPSRYARENFCRDKKTKEFVNNVLSVFPTN